MLIVNGHPLRCVMPTAKQLAAAAQACPEAVMAVAAELGLARLSEEFTAGRHVYADGKYVYKLDPNGEAGNAWEWRLWCAAEPAQRDILARCAYITDCSKVLVMERLEQDEKYQAMYDAMLRSELDNWLQRAGLLVPDSHIGNFGRDGDQLKCLDYGLASMGTLVHPVNEVR